MQIKLIHIVPFFLIAITTFFSCSDMNSVQEKYSTAEKIYAGKLDSLHYLTGYKKVKIIGLSRYLGKSNECTVSWDNKSKKFPIDNIIDGKFEMIIDDLEERSYEFTITTSDVDNNQSVIQIIKARALGDIFKNSEIARRLVSFNFVGKDVYANWADKAESIYVVYTTIRYENNSNGISTAVVYPDDLKTKLVNIKFNGKLEIISTIGRADSFETFDLDPVEQTLPGAQMAELDKTLFSLAGMASDNPGTSYGGNPGKYLFDGDGRWSGNDGFGYHSGENAIPHHFTIDLGLEYEVRKCVLGLRDPNNYSGNNPKEVEIWGRLDLINAETSDETSANFISKGWKLLFSGPIDGANKQTVEFDIEASAKVRYLRYKVLKTVNMSGSQLTEMTFWGY